VDEKASGELNQETYHERGQDAEGSSQSRFVLDFLEAVSSSVCCAGQISREGHWEATYKSEQKTSIAFTTAFENRTMRQTLVKTVLRQSEFGISAGRCRRSRRASHIMKRGIKATLTSNKEIFAGRDMYETELVSILNECQH
jgi:hypothetical protein